MEFLCIKRVIFNLKNSLYFQIILDTARNTFIPNTSLAAHSQSEQFSDLN